MADIIDDAQALNDVYQAASFTAAGFSFGAGKPSPVLAPQSHPDFDGVHCVDCGVDIPPQRLAWGRIRCTECEEYLVRDNRLRAIRGREE